MLALSVGVGYLDRFLLPIISPFSPFSGRGSNVD